jgi:hypothetical protein
MAWTQSSDLNTSADVLDTAYAFADLVGKRPEASYAFTNAFEERPKSLPAERLRFWAQDTTFNVRCSFGNLTYHNIVIK